MLIHGLLHPTPLFCVTASTLLSTPRHELNTKSLYQCLSVSDRPLYIENRTDRRSPEESRYWAFTCFRGVRSKRRLLVAARPNLRSTASPFGQDRRITLVLLADGITVSARTRPPLKDPAQRGPNRPDQKALSAMPSKDSGIASKICQL